MAARLVPVTVDGLILAAPEAPDTESGDHSDRTSRRRPWDAATHAASEPRTASCQAGTLGPFRARIVYQLVASPTGTRLTNSVELDPPVPLGPFGAMLGSRLRTSVAENLNVLKQLLEGPRLS